MEDDTIHGGGSACLLSRTYSMVAVTFYAYCFFAKTHSKRKGSREQPRGEGSRGSLSSSGGKFSVSLSRPARVAPGVLYLLSHPHPVS